MSSINKVILVGNVGNIDVKEYERNGEKKPLVQISLATSDGYKGKDGEWRNETEWHRCIFAIPSLAERAKSVSKGDTIYVEGSIKTNKWTDKDGNEKSIKEISVVSYRTWKKSKSVNSSNEEPSPVKKEDESDDGLPF